MKKIAFVVVWMGNLPNYFRLWLKSCKKNESIDFWVFTDQRYQREIPDNVKMMHLSFQEVRERIQKIFEFPICLERPYKLCDYKPTYGEAFSDFLQEYDFWGYCDIDLIWGNIREFLTDDILNQNERIFTRGHCSLFRNDVAVNSYYRTLESNGRLSYREVYQSDESWCFDEWAGHCGGGLSFIFADHHIATYDEPIMADIMCGRGHFYINRRPDVGKVNYFHYQNGNLFACSKAGKYPILYCHFQKRKMHIETIAESFKIFPPGVVCADTRNNNSMQNKVLSMCQECKYAFRKIRYSIRKLMG